MEALQHSVEQTRSSRGKKSDGRRASTTTTQKPARKPAGKSTKKTTAKTTPPKQTTASTTARSRGTGKRELRQLSKTELYQRAGEQGIAGRSKMSHDELVDTLARAGRRRKKTAA